ncbi:hypothetical protein FRB96_001053 [Tulasnella sp. 330]|nr:hypothetical protein FRB96_001053 [Tulasnella sp. 330]
MLDSEDAVQQTTLPTFAILSRSDVQHAANIVQEMYSPQATPERSQVLQHDLLELQKRPEAWGLVVPFIDSSDAQIQFFGAHTAQVKIARDWEQWPHLHVHALRDMLLTLTGRAASRGVSRVVMRKLYVSLSALALRLCPTQPSLWNDWIKDALGALLSGPPECAPDFLCISIEEVNTADLLPASKTRLTASIRDSLPAIMGLLTSNIRVRPEVPISGRIAWLKATEAWIGWGLPGDELVSLVPILNELLRDRDTFLATCDVLEEIMTKSSMASGRGTKVLTEPLLEWVASEGAMILQESLTAGAIDEISHAFCKLILALGEHSAVYIAEHMLDPNVQTLMRVILGYTGLPGWFGVDEDESELTLSFWFSLGEAVLDSDFGPDSEPTRYATIQAVLVEMVLTLVRKSRWPTAAEGLGSWAKDQRDRFQNFRRDLGDTLLNTYYILRDELFKAIIPGTAALLASPTPQPEILENVESALHIVKAVQEAVALQPNEYLAVVFGPSILGRLPTGGKDRIRWTILNLIGAYATWFHAQETTDLLMLVMNYVVSAFAEPALSLHAARALRDLCENNRKALSSQIDSFAALYANLHSIPDAEKTKVLQAICSVVQALPPQAAIAHVYGIVSPLVTALTDILAQATTAPEEARNACVSQLRALSGCAKGLTNNVAPLVAISISDDEELEQVRDMEVARADPLMVELRIRITGVLGVATNIWSADAEVGEALSELIKSMTSLPGENTLLSLPPGPVLELICVAAQRQVTAVWLSLAQMLTQQLNPPTYSTIRTLPHDSVTKDAQDIAAKAAAALVQTSLQVLSAQGAMDTNPDIVRALFTYMMTVVTTFPASFLRLPQPLMDSVMQCAITGLTLTERYSLVDAAKFLHTFCRKTIGEPLDINNGRSILSYLQAGSSSASPEHAPQAKEILKKHGPAMSRAILAGIAGASPRTTIPNLVDLLAILISKIPEHRVWMKEVLFSPQLDNPKLTQAAKDKFLQIATTSRSIRQTCDAANEFSLVARGLDGSSFGYASVGA